MEEPRPPFPKGGLPIGAGLEDLGKGFRSVVGHHVRHPYAKGARYLEMAEGYIKKIGLDENDEIIGYEFVQLGIMMELIEKGTNAAEALQEGYRNLRPLSGCR